MAELSTKKAPPVVLTRGRYLLNTIAVPEKVNGILLSNEKKRFVATTGRFEDGFAPFVIAAVPDQDPVFKVGDKVYLMPESSPSEYKIHNGSTYVLVHEGEILGIAK